MKLETKRKIRRWVCRRLGLPETETVTVPYPVKVYVGNPETLCIQGSYRVSEREWAVDYFKRTLAEHLADALLEKDRCQWIEEDSPYDLMQKLVTVKVRVVPWKE